MLKVYKSQNPKLYLIGRTSCFPSQFPSCNIIHTQTPSYFPCNLHLHGEETLNIILHNHRHPSSSLSFLHLRRRTGATSSTSCGVVTRWRDVRERVSGGRCFR
ncbi:hypothetical protein Hdeb2414_s0007g00245621 [Helianthus debilis subsp. tardiflorus]